MAIAARLVIRVRAIVDNRNGRETSAAMGHSSGAVRDLDRLHVSLRSRRREIAVVIETTDLLVEVEELSNRDDAGIQRTEPVLHADVVNGPSSETGLRIDSEDVDVRGEDIA